MQFDDPVRRNLPLNSRWVTQDGSPWWLRSGTFNQPDGDYKADCFLDVSSVASADSVEFDDQNCNYHSKSYYCQSEAVNLAPKDGAPDGCTCKKVELSGAYSAGSLVKCSTCKDVWRSHADNSCPYGTKIFSPRSREDWKTFLASAAPVRAPHFIMDVTRPQDGCGGCKDHAMKSTIAEVATWKTSDSSPWWIRADKFTAENDDYKANCFMNMFTFDTEDSVAFDMGQTSLPTEDQGVCRIHSRTYYCQAFVVVTTTTTTTTTASDAPPAPQQCDAWTARGDCSNQGIYMGRYDTPELCQEQCKLMAAGFSKKVCCHYRPNSRNCYYSELENLRTAPTTFPYTTASVAAWKATYCHIPVPPTPAPTPAPTEAPANATASTNATAPAPVTDGSSDTSESS